MGLLDDAIREHLELKRRHGADPSEVAKQEQEALGPVRRSDALAAPDPSAHALAEEEERAYEDTVLDAGDDPLEHAPLADDPLAHPAGAGPAESPLDPPPVVAAEAPPIPEPAPEPPAPTEPEPVPPAPDPQETVAFSAIEEPEVSEPAPEPAPAAPTLDDRPRAPAPPPVDVVPADEDPADDELAETPDFLQETPEHDRLWFEQKPPRDFDF